jgi:alkylmercury lyase
MPRLHQGRVLGFAGLAATALHHRFELDGRALSAWCAWDSLFLPEILGRPARVSSVDPESGEIVRLVVTPERIVSVEPNPDFLHSARRARLWHVRRKCDGEILPFHFLFRVTLVGRALG